MTGAVRVEGHVLRREPASRAQGRPGETAVPALSVPFILLPEGRNAEVAQLIDDDSEQGTRRRLRSHEISHVRREAAVSTTFSVPFNLSPEVRNAEVAQPTEDGSEQCIPCRL